MAKPYREGDLWSFRLRIRQQDIYRTGFVSAASATKALDALRHELQSEGRPAHGGPWRITLAQALQTYAVERLPTLKGADQDANRINRYLRAAGLDLIRVTRPAAGSADSPQGPVHWIVSLVPAPAKRPVPRGLSGHRKAQATRTRESDKQRSILAQTTVADIESYQIQKLIDVMCQEGSQPATIGLERALLRRLFNYARRSWNWSRPTRNPATHLTLPKIDNARDRVLTNKELAAISPGLEKSLNPYAAPAIVLLLETAMRVSEPLLQATWADIDWDRWLLRLRDAKAGARDVPLNPSAILALKMLLSLRRDDDPDPRILPITYEALKAVWNRACVAAGIHDVRIHDLRHTAATRFTLELNGNLPVLKVITGHKTYSQLSRYINVKPADVARLLHSRPLTEDDAPAGLHLPRATLVPPPTEAIWNEADLPENVLPLRRTKEVANSG
jgi:integrase